MQTIKK